MNKFNTEENSRLTTTNGGRDSVKRTSNSQVDSSVHSAQAAHLSTVEYNNYRKAHYRNTMPDSRILVFLTGFCIGMVFFYISRQDNICPLDREQIVWLQSIDIYQIGLLEYIFRIRLKQLVFFTICALSSIGKALAYMIIGWYGFELGVILFTLMYQYGVKGIFLSCCMFLPQGLFYLAAFLILFSQYWEDSGKSDQQANPIEDKSIWGALTKMKKPTIILLVFCLGMLCEAYINPVIMKKMAFFF